VNIATESGLAESYGIEGTPTLVIFFEGNEVDRVAGPPPVFADILAFITEPLQA
jgi:thioredoxin-like negative regulator of GroEL